MPEKCSVLVTARRSRVSADPGNRERIERTGGKELARLDAEELLQRGGVAIVDHDPDRGFPLEPPALHRGVARPAPPEGSLSCDVGLEALGEVEHRRGLGEADVAAELRLTGNEVVERERPQPGPTEQLGRRPVQIRIGDGTLTVVQLRADRPAAAGGGSVKRKKAAGAVPVADDGHERVAARIADRDREVRAQERAAAAVRSRQQRVPRRDLTATQLARPEHLNPGHLRLPGTRRRGGPARDPVRTSAATGCPTAPVAGGRTRASPVS